MTGRLARWPLGLVPATATSDATLLVLVRGTRAFADGFVSVLLPVYLLELGFSELRVAARKPGHRPKTLTHQAVYLGPMEQMVDDFGNVFRRGVPTPINVHDWQVLSKGAASGMFLFLKAEPIAEGCCGDSKG